jgi:transcriptional regulator GlxA family with amidase domain
MAAKRRRTGPKVAALILDRTAVFELAVPCEVFGIDRSDIASPWYQFKVCSGADGPVRTQGGFSINAEHGLEGLAGADLVVIPAGPSGAYPLEALDAVREAHRKGARVMSLCTGAFLLAEAGLLNGRRATTHWRHASELAARYPEIEVDPRVLYVDEGDVLTSAGTAAGIDLCLHVVRQDYGAEVANAVARRMVVPPHRDGGQAQYVEMPVGDTDCGDALSRALEWMLEHLDQTTSIEELARLATMSPRTFARRFRAVTGTTPHQWLVAQRVLMAQRLLETTDDSIERVADAAGLGTAANLRLHFQRVVGTSPLAYRRTFRRSDQKEAATA